MEAAVSAGRAPVGSGRFTVQTYPDYRAGVAAVQCGLLQRVQRAGESEFDQQQRDFEYAKFGQYFAGAAVDFAADLVVCGRPEGYHWTPRSRSSRWICSSERNCVASMPSFFAAST